jgi:isoleucyl-tRNA synthetase
LYSLSARLDAKTGKPKYGKLFGPLQSALESLPAAQVAAQVRQGQGVSLKVEGEIVDVRPEEIIVAKTAREGWELAEGNGFIVAISTQLDAGLIREGLVRDLVRHIQNLRKEKGFYVADRIRIAFAAGEELAAAVSAHSDYLAGETLALEIHRQQGPIKGAYTVKLGGESIEIAIRKV